MSDNNQDNKILHDLENTIVKLKSIIKITESKDYDSVDELEELLIAGDESIQNLGEIWLFFKNKHIK